ncbi:MAG: hypothetical protein H6710_21755 [Myxococcales bacterium]|nr:hypothetical protein [Myxococcales bacterium]MCB9706403.1 hypothetical protein [Myxococcales bacterium]
MSGSLGDGLALTPQLQLAIRMLSSAHVEMLRWLEEVSASQPALRWRPPAAPSEVDAVIERGDDGLRCELSDEGELEVDEEAPEEAQREAAWLVRAAERRRESIARLLALVIEAQGPFLRGERPRPQRLAVATLADELGFHASTVRRLVEGKRLRVNGREIDLAELVG